MGRTVSVFFVLIACGFTATTVFAQPPQQTTPPNVLLVITDDQGWGDVRSHGNDTIDTPVQDRLASQGARFDRFYVSPVCAPTRASLLTGRYHLRTGTVWVTHNLESMRAEEVTLAEGLKQAGYVTGCFGKWHNGAHYPQDPKGQGFDEFFGFCAGNWNNYFDTHLIHNGKRVPTKGYITDVITDAALQFIEANKSRPFFCYVPYNAPHEPFQVPDRYFDKYKQRDLNDKDATVYGMVENIDDNLGRLLHKLDELALTKNTIVLFMTDNGPNGQRYNGKMRGIKGTVYEGGVRVPLFIRWPGHITPGITVKPITAHIDLLPTIIELCGVPMPKTLPLDGMSLVPLLKQDVSSWPDRMLFTHQSHRGEVQLSFGAVRTQQHHLVCTRQHWELYDMINDPGETKNIADQYPEITKKLRQAYETWFKDVTATGTGPLPIPVGYAEAPEVELPAHECSIEGTIHYTIEPGWCHDWLTGWKSVDDTVQWDIDVVQAGRYDVTLLYTCSPQNVGAKIRIAVNDQQIEGVIRQPHDPAPIPSPDRTPRRTVDEKEWGHLQLGQLNLDSGRAKLYVKAVTKPGKEVCDLKAIRLRRVD